jgi:Chalcone isomerase-like
MKSRIINFLLFITISFGADAQLTLNGVTLPAKIKQDNTELVLNGGGIRKKVFFKVYVAGLYVTDKSKNGNDVVAADKPMAVRLTVTSTLINSSNMSDAIQEGFGKSLKGNTTPLQPQITAFIATFKKEEIKEGDVFEMWYIPGTGVKSYKNGQFKGTVTGLDFKKALFGIWLSDTPVDEDLKKGLLGS